jgi:pilus assembly protein CpaE
MDLPHVWTSWIKKTLLAADEIVITVEPDLANLRNTKNLVDLLRQARKHEEIKVDEFAAALNLTPVAVIPFEAHLFGTAANNGQMISEADPKSGVVPMFSQIAQTVTGRGEVKKKKSGAFGPMLARLRGKKKVA